MRRCFRPNFEWGDRFGTVVVLLCTNVNMEDAHVHPSLGRGYPWGFCSSTAQGMMRCYIYGPYDNDITKSDSGFWHFVCSFSCVFVIFAFEMAWSGWVGLGFFCSSHAVYFCPAMDLNLAFLLAQLGFTWLSRLIDIEPFGRLCFTRYVFY